MSQVLPTDELAHPVGAEEAWSESHYFNFFDPSKGVGGLTRIGVRPNEGRMDGVLVLFLPGGWGAFVYTSKDQTENTETLEVGGVRYSMDTPLERWGIVCEAEGFMFPQPAPFGPKGTETRRVRIGLGLDFTAISPAVGISPLADPGRIDEVPQGHFEQAGSWRGSIEVGEERIELSGFGNRDKSWGVRDWRAPSYWRWFSANFGDDHAAGGFRLGTGLKDVESAWIWRKQGGPDLVKKVDVESKAGEDGIMHLGTRLDLESGSGKSHRIEGTTIAFVSLPMNREGRRTLINEALVEWRYGDLVGYGIAEYLHQIDSEGRILVPV